MGSALLAWQFSAWFVERPIHYSGAAPQRCGLQVDSKYAASVSRIHDQVASMMAGRRIPGMAVAVGVRGKLVYSEGFGYADLRQRTPACPETQFRVGSVSKLFTAVAMARLVERGALDLDAPIQRYVPSFPDKGARITAGLLAAHRAGIRPYHDDMEAINRKHYASITAALAPFANDPLVAAPGSQFIYSNYGYVLLSAAIEGAAGEPFLDVMRQLVFEPLRMNATVPDDIFASLPSRSANYDVETPFSPDGSLVSSPANDFSSKWASGGFLSTAEDLVRFGTIAVPADLGGRTGDVLRQETIDLLTRVRSGVPPVAGYGMGWMAASDLHLRRVYFHFGAASGGTAVLVVYPGSGVVVALLANLGHAKFPFRPLVNIARPFLPSPRPDLPVFAAGIVMLAGLLWMLRRTTPARRSLGTHDSR
ncbi:MAG TPA: serine hydrolase domain-containing protein [Gemmatimonadaceae bacterium]|jgi:CubicO group peptidase (beta-lactamase class C family)